MSEEAVRHVLPWSFHAYAWQQQTWQYLNKQLAENRLPHGLLVSGAEGVGKERLVKSVAARLLCNNPGVDACGQCKSCQLMEKGNHPDLFWMTLEINPKTDKYYTVIRVEQVRELGEFAAKSSQMGGWRIVVIAPADLLNVNAANALLKTLEEPGDRTLIMLLTSQPQSLLPTIRSRCQQLVLEIPGQAEALEWLKLEIRDEAKARLLLSLANGAPLAAQAMQSAQWFAERKPLLRDLKALLDKQQTALAVAKSWQGLGAKELLLALDSLVADIVVVASGATIIKHQDLASAIQSIAEMVSPAGVLRFRQGLAEKQRLLAGNIAGSALLDALFTEWAQLKR